MSSRLRASWRAGTIQSVNLGLGLVGVLALVLGVWQIHNLIALPFSAPQTAFINTNTTASNLTNLSADSPEVQALKQKDSDGDGLSDYDEIYLYHTSPYLQDTDSDNDNDGAEVRAGRDPLDKMPGRQGSGLVSTASGSGSSNTAAPAAPTPAQIRAFLKQNGASDQLLAKYDDATLLKLYGEVSTSADTATTPGSSTSAAANTNTGLSANTNTSANMSLTPAQRQALGQLSGAQLRQLLINGGADAQLLSQFDDVTLQAIVKQTLGL